MRRHRIVLFKIAVTIIVVIMAILIARGDLAHDTCDGSLRYTSYCVGKNLNR